MASLAITDICVDSACTIKKDAKIYKDYRSSPQEVTDPSEAALNVNCLQYIWVRSLFVIYLENGVRKPRSDFCSVI